MKIEIASYDREDGLAMFRLPDKKNWVIRRIGPGPTWFYNPTSGEWDISSVSGFDTKPLGRPFEETMRLFETIPKD